MKSEIDNPEFYRPVTETYSYFERWDIAAAEDAIARFQETGKPVSVWTHDQWDSDSRRVRLTTDEINRQITEIFMLCGVSDDFHSAMRLIKKPYDSFVPDESTFGEHRPDTTELVQWLGDFDTFTRDFANDFNVGFVLESPLGLVALKYTSEECGLICGDCPPRNDGYSCDHFEGEFDVQGIYQISLYPKDAMNDISFEASKYGHTS